MTTKAALAGQIQNRSSQNISPFLKDALEIAGVNKCPYCLQYWREEYQIFIKFGKVFWWCEAPPEILSITFEWLKIL